MRLEIPVGGREIVLETGKLARQAGGAVTARLGDTVVLATATRSSAPRPGVDFLPLSVDIEERMSAAGKIPGGFLKREGRPSERAILTCRLIDRPLRPLFPKGYRNEIQVVGTVLGADQETPYDTVSMVGASAALALSDLPFDGPIGAVRVGRTLDGEFVLNPTYQQISEGDLDLVVAGTKEAITMVEAGANEVPEEVMVEAMILAHDAIREQCEAIEGWAAEHGKEKQEFVAAGDENPFLDELREKYLDRIKDAIVNPDRRGRGEALEELRAELVEGREEEEAGQIQTAISTLQKEAFRKLYLEDRKRTDLRALDEIRPNEAEVGIIPRVHGTGLYTRGETQVLSSLALADLGLAQRLDTIEPGTGKRYMHHYNFPGYSTGETRPMRSPGRREIGHGALAERALLPVIPSVEDFPYTIRTVSEVVSSNGSTSMASVCGSTMSLMDAGVPLKAPVAGIAMGLIMKDDGGYVVLSDIMGAEDFAGDMDFKVAGTESGITALQMDIKVKGITTEIMARALDQAKVGRAHILGKMLEVIAEPRADLAPHAPRIHKLMINPEKIREVIGKGGETINRIIADTGVEIDIEDTGLIMIASSDGDSAQRAINIIKALVAEPEVGTIYDGTVVKIMEFGAFVNIMPGRDGLVHISQLANERVAHVEDVVKLGDRVKVKLMEVDAQGRLNLSLKAAEASEESER